MSNPTQTLDPGVCIVDTVVDIPIVNGNEEVTGTFISFKNMEREHFAIAFGRWREIENPVVRLHSECITGDVFMSRRCDCGEQLKEAISLLAKQDGILLYLRQEGRGIGLYSKFAAYRLQDQGFDTFMANQQLGFKDDERDFAVAAKMLTALNKSRIYLHTNNMEKKKQLTDYGIEVVDIIATKVYENPHNRNYLDAKEKLAGHKFIK